MRIIICSLITILLIVCISHANEKTYLSFHHVIEECENCNKVEFVQGKSLFPDFKLHWLPDDFLIKKTPELRLTSSDITNVSVEQISIAGKKNNFLISIQLINKTRALFVEYTNKNIGEKFAVKINDIILNVVTVNDVLNGEEFTFVVRNIERDELLKTLRSLSDVTQVGSDGSP